MHTSIFWRQAAGACLVLALLSSVAPSRADVIFPLPEDAILLTTVFQENPEGFQDQFRVGFAYYKMGPAQDPANSGMRAWFNTPDLPIPTGAALWGGTHYQ